MQAEATFYLTGHNNFGNRGCEALVRGTVQAVRAQIPAARFLVPSLDIARDSRQWPEAAAEGVQLVEAPTIGPRFVQWSRACRRLPFLTGLPWPRLASNDPLRRQLMTCDAILSIGGDNYSLDYDISSLAFFVAVAEAGLDAHLPVVLWGASIGPFDAKPQIARTMARHLKRLSAVMVRETHSLAYARRLGLDTELHSVVDSAFLLSPTPLDMADFWPRGEHGVVGLNLSPLIDRVRQRAGASGALIDEAAAWIRSLVSDSSAGVLLVPHVAPLDGRQLNNDEVYITRLLHAVTDLGGRVRTVTSGLNAAELKYVISRCRYFIGARTHATIAAMSTGVPTLSIAYSVKARGISLDLFGHEHYVLDTRQLSQDSLTAGLDLLRRDESEIRALLDRRLPLWRERAGAGAVIVSELLHKKPVAKTALKMG